MKKMYTIEVQETLARQVEIEASSEKEAIEKVRELYENYDIVLDYSDMVGGTEFDLVGVKEIEEVTC